jgi:hypothetical protein
MVALRCHFPLRSGRRLLLGRIRRLVVDFARIFGAHWALDPFASSRMHGRRFSAQLLGLLKPKLLLFGRGFDVDGGFRQFAQFFVRLFFFFKGLRKQLGSFLIFKQFGISAGRAVARHFVVLDSLSRRD